MRVDLSKWQDYLFRADYLVPTSTELEQALEVLEQHFVYSRTKRTPVEDVARHYGVCNPVALLDALESKRLVVVWDWKGMLICKVRTKK